MYKAVLYCGIIIIITIFIMGAFHGGSRWNNGPRTRLERVSDLVLAGKVNCATRNGANITLVPIKYRLIIDNSLMNSSGAIIDVNGNELTWRNGHGNALELVSCGKDGLLGTSDDIIVPVVWSIPENSSRSK